jgi:hypothetical protein
MHDLGSIPFASKFFLFGTASRPTPRRTEFLTQWAPKLRVWGGGRPPTRLKRPEHEADRVFSYSVEVNDM